MSLNEKAAFAEIDQANTIAEVDAIVARRMRLAYYPSILAYGEQHKNFLGCIPSSERGHGQG